MTENALAQTTTTDRSAAWADVVDRLSASAGSIYVLNAGRRFFVRRR